MLFRDFNRNLYHELGWLLLKDFSQVERYYLNILRKSLDSTLNEAVSWLDSNYSELDGLSVSDFDDYWEGSRLQRLLISLLSYNRERSVYPLSDFYRSGAGMVYGELGFPSVFLDSDRYALDNLKGYVGSVSDSINSEFNTGIRRVIRDNLGNGKDDCVDALLGLQYRPIESRFSVDTRCIFTARSEYARAVNTGVLQAYCNYGVDSFDVVTSGLGNVCDVCLDLEDGNPYSFDEIVGLMPVHVNCNCGVRGRYRRGDVRLQDSVRVVDLTR